MNEKFRIGLTRDFLAPDGKLTYKDMGLRVLDAEPSVEYEFFPRHEPVVKVDQLQDYAAVISLAPRYTPDSLRGVQRLTALFRCGVGYDFVDVKACTENDVALFITVGAVNYSVARLREKDAPVSRARLVGVLIIAVCVLACRSFRDPEFAGEQIEPGSFRYSPNPENNVDAKGSGASPLFGGLFGYLYLQTGDARYRQLARECFDYLMANPDMIRMDRVHIAGWMLRCG